MTYTQVYIKALENIPIHEDIDKFKYNLLFDDGSCRWFANHKSNGESIWLIWNGETFNKLNSSKLPITGELHSVYFLEKITDKK